MSEYNPRHYQTRMTEFILNRKRSALFCEMGLGKTVTTLTAIDKLVNDQFQVRKVLILAPLRVALLTWPDELKKWNHTRRLTYSVIYGNGNRSAALNEDVDIHIMSYSTLPWLVEYIKKYRGLPFDYDMVIYDESTYIKNKSSKRWTICNALFHEIERKVLLTGTPSPNGLHDLWGQMFHLDHGRALGTSLGTFRYMFFMRVNHKYLPLKNASEKIQQKIAHLAMPMKAVDYLSLPKFTLNKVPCLLPRKYAADYTQLEKEFFIKIDGEDTTAFDAAALSMKLRQYVQGFLINDEGEITDVHDVKLSALSDIVDQTNDNLFVAVQFRHDIEKITSAFPDAACIYGGTRMADDLENIRLWNDGKLKMLVAHPGSLAHGVNLQTGGHTVVWYGLPWSLEHFDQFNARIYRQGQAHPVICHVLLTRGTMDEVIYEALQGKTMTQESLMRGIEAYRKLKSEPIISVDDLL